MEPLSKNFNFNLRRNLQKKISYEPRDYESVDEKSHVPKNYENRIQEGKGQYPDLLSIYSLPALFA